MNSSIHVSEGGGQNTAGFVLVSKQGRVTAPEKREKCGGRELRSKWVLLLGASSFLYHRNFMGLLQLWETKGREWVHVPFPTACVWDQGQLPW